MLITSFSIKRFPPTPTPYTQTQTSVHGECAHAMHYKQQSQHSKQQNCGTFC